MLLLSLRTYAQCRYVFNDHLNYPSSISVHINEHACTAEQNYDCKRFVSYPSNKLCVCASHLKQDVVITCQLTRQAL
jgi:hypothetical protein